MRCTKQKTTKTRSERANSFIEELRNQQIYDLRFHQK
jgi:hypothetical protein